ncbi:MAG: M48 family metalloprotease [Candidatus Rokubacteria bacterium]|nr:M48 family metalloprotease [Candidatus Rokubacteria bacterium]
MAADDARARRYHRLQLWLGLAGLAVEVLYLAAVLASGVARPVADAAGRLDGALAWRVAVVAAALGLGERILTAPLVWLRGYWLPRRYGLLHQSLGGWLGDRLKAAAIAGVLGLITVEVIYALVAATALWWLMAAAVLVGLQVVTAFVFPVWLLPLFYRLEPLADEGLRRRLLALAARVGIPVVGVWVADQSRKSRTANAVLAGLGRTRRIVLFDTLVRDFAPDEIEAVLAHELGHHVHRDVWRGLGVQAAVTVLALGIADRLLRLGVGLLGLEGPADPAGLPWLALVLLGVGLLAAPAANAFSRRIERQADDFALAATGDPGAFVRALERLAALNLAERRPHRLKEVLLFSHPSIDRRIARATRAA